MLTIEVQKAEKRYHDQLIFKNFTFSFKSPIKYAITGQNGTGKSTLLACLSGFISLTKGQISYIKEDILIDASYIYKYLFVVSPYTDLIEEMTLKELFIFFKQFKTTSYTYLDFKAYLDLKNIDYKYIKVYSSGMKQKVKLALAFCFDIPLLFLDEPTANLDEANSSWYLDNIQKLSNRLIIIASNDKREYSFCDKILCMD